MEGEEKYLLEIFCFFNFVTLKFLQHVGYEAGEGEVDMVFNEMREEWKKWKKWVIVRTGEVLFLKKLYLS